MELDDLKQVWRAIERSLAIDERLLRETLLRKARFALAPYIVWRALEVVFGVGMLLAVMPVLARHTDDVRYLLVGVPLAAYVVAITAMCVRLLDGSLRIDYAGAVTAIQHEVARIKRTEYRTFTWALLGGIVFWLPALLFVVEAVTGVAVLARVDATYLVANLAFGAAVLAIGMPLANRHAGHSRVVDALTGRALRRMEAQLAELASFQREP
jgi:hypothetical protein